MIGRKVLHYQIESKLGEGGMGAVYKAHDTRLGRDVALKFLPHRLAAPGSVERARFEVEARAAAALNHPNVAVIHAIEECDDELFLVMELIEGTRLSDRIARGAVTPQEFLRFATQMTEGLKAAHEKGIVHRDIKSSNVMLTPSGTIKIMDFGLARIGGGSDLTATATTFGTVAYMSPEQVRGETVDARSDIWSLGVVLYELLTGRTPFRGEHDQAVLYAVVNDEPAPPSALAPGVSPQFDRLVAKAMAKPRHARYQHVSELLADLTPGASEGALSTRPPALAVLPFASIKPDPEMDFLGFALADQIIGSLSYVKELLVRPSSAVRKFQGQSTDARAVARELGVELLLTGFYLKQDEVIRLNVEMVDVRTNEMVWRDSIHVRYENAFEMQDLVAGRVLNELAVRFSNEERDRMRADVPADPLAFEYYLRAVAYPQTEDGDKLAAGMLEQAIALDAKYAPAWSELGYRLNRWAAEGMLGRAAYDRSEAAYRQALTLNPNLISALWQLSNHLTESARPEEAAQLIERIFELTPDSAVAHYTLGYLYRYTGLLDEAVREVERALVLDPRNPRFRGAGFTYVYRGEYQKAYDAFALDPAGTVAIAWRGMTLFLMGQREAAIEHLDRAAGMEPDTFVGTRHAAVSAHIKGDTEKGLALLRKLEARLPLDHDPEHWYLLSTAYGLMGNREGCIRALEASVAGGFFNYPCFVRDPQLDVARGDAQFERILTIAKQKHENFKRRAAALERTFERTATRAG